MLKAFLGWIKDKSRSGTENDHWVAPRKSQLWHQRKQGLNRLALENYCSRGYPQQDVCSQIWQSVTANLGINYAEYGPKHPGRGSGEHQPTSEPSQTQWQNVKPTSAKALVLSLVQALAELVTINVTPCQHGCDIVPSWL